MPGNQLTYIIANFTFEQVPNESIGEDMVEFFSGKNSSLLEYVFHASENRINFSILGKKKQLLKTVFSGIKEFRSRQKPDSEQYQPTLTILSFSSLRIDYLDELCFEIEGIKERIANKTEKCVVEYGYLAPAKNIPYLSYYRKCEPKLLLKTIAESKSLGLAGRKYLNDTSDILFVGVRPLPVGFVVRVAFENPRAVQTVCDKMASFGKVAFELKSGEIIEDEIVKTVNRYSIPEDLALIGVRIEDYAKIPVHKVMIYVFDLFEQHGVIPVDSEFISMFPLEVIRIATDDLFYDVKKPEDISREIREVLTLFQFNIDDIFELPSMLIEKRFNLHDILNS